VICAPAARADTLPVVPFQATYRGYNPWDEWNGSQPDKCTESQPIYGSEPAAAGTYPVLLYMHGTYADWGGNQEGQRVVALAAAQGFVAPAPTYDSWLTLSPNGVDRHAQCMFSPAASANAVAQVCARAKADCSRGILVAGFSQGGAIAARAANFSGDVRAAWVMGVSGPAISAALAAPAGTRVLPDDRVRIDVGEADVDTTDATTGKVTGMQLNALNAVSGSGCSTPSCLRPDGSGYYVVQNSDVADGVADHCYWQSVATQNPANSCVWTPTFDPGFPPPSTKPWSLPANLDWLRAQLQ
jgi:pimeloyl-ACP methyl ester carboxylesterase